VNSPNTFAFRVCLLFGVGVFFAVAATWQFIPRNGDENDDADLSAVESFDSTPDPAILAGRTGISLSSFTKAGETPWFGSGELTIASDLGERESIINRPGIVSISDITKSFITAFDGINLQSGLLEVTGTTNAVAGSFPMFGPSLGARLSRENPNAVTSSAIWLASPVDGDWNNSLNWSAGGPPNGATDTATFGSSNLTSIFLSNYTTVDSIVFNPGASAYTIAAGLTFSLTVNGAGITNNSGITQNFTTDGDGFNRGFIVFNSGTVSSTGGGAIVFTNNGGVTEFAGSSNAGNSTYINNGNAVAGSPSEVQFIASSHAGTGTFTSNGATATGALGGLTTFIGVSHGDTATFTSNGSTVNGANGGVTDFGGGSFADGATLIANAGSNGGLGGIISFSSVSTGGTSRVEVFGNGNLDLHLHTGSVTIGSLEGTGVVLLAGRNLTVGSNDLTTTFSGVIKDGSGYTNGSLTKIGTGTLTLTGANTYTGGTTINGGILAAGVGGLVSVSGTITVNSGGTLMLSGSGQHIGVNIPMTLNGGTFNTNGLSEGSPGSRGIGALTLTATSTIDFGAGASSVIEFGGLGTHTAGTVLQITNWNGVPVTGGNGDRLLFEGVATSFSTAYNQSDVSFNGVVGYDVIQFLAGDIPYYEVTAFAPIPEPSTWLGGGLVLGVLGWTLRRRFTLSKA
jgi:autotransporter-associated beta strand protein